MKDKESTTRTTEATPLCLIHQRLESAGKLTCEIGGNNCVACSLNERAELLTLLAPFAAKDGSEDSLTVLRRLADFSNTHQGDGRVVVSYPAPAPQPVLDTSEWVIEETFSGKVLIRDSQDQPVARVNRRQDAVQIVSDHRSATAVPRLITALKSARSTIFALWDMPDDPKESTVVRQIDEALNQTGGER
jgi:hypothetical protein